MNLQAWTKVGLLALLACALAGCEVLGPRVVRVGRPQYNAAVNDTDLEQLLLNIVRLRFNDRPYFLEVSSISASGEFTAAGGAKGIGDSASGELGLNYKEKPNIVYLPLAGEKFVRQLLTPLDLQTLMLLRGAGWELDPIFRTFVNRINGIPNAPIGAGTTPEDVPKFRDFLQVAEAFDELEDRGAILLGAVEDRQDTNLVFTVDPAERESREMQQLLQLLRLDPKAGQYRIEIGLGEGGGNVVVIEPRAVIGAMFYLGQSIEVPDEIREKGWADFTRDREGRVFEWSEVHENLMRIRSSREQPKDAFVKVRYFDHWFYIHELDLAAKETITMLSVVFMLQAGGLPSGAPVLTLPVTR